MKENVHNDQMIVLLGGILIMLLLLAMGIVYFEGMTHIKTFIYAMCFWTVDIYWGFVGIICIRKRIADMLRGEVNHKRLTKEFLMYSMLIMLPLLCFMLSVRNGI